MLSLLRLQSPGITAETADFAALFVARQMNLRATVPKSRPALTKRACGGWLGVASGRGELIRREILDETYESHRLEEVWAAGGPGIM